MAKATDDLCLAAQMQAEALLEKMSSSFDGLSAPEASRRLTIYGYNRVAHSQRKTPLARILTNLGNPLVILLSVLAVTSIATGDPRAAAMMLVMIVLGVSVRFFQELKADDAAEKLKEMVKTTTTVRRDRELLEIPIETVVPGDVLVLSAGDMVSADVRLLASKDLFINQSTLTGESHPVEKHAGALEFVDESLDAENLCFQGTTVETGTATALALMTGGHTQFGKLASVLSAERKPTSFETSTTGFTWLMIGFILIMVPVVLVVNGVLKHDWLQAFTFALAVGVGLTPEMLPMIVAVNLAKGAIVMSQRKVIVKSLDSIQNLGAMDVLCMDKTGTLTQGKVVLLRNIDLDNQESSKVLNYAYLNSFYQTGLKNLTDVAVLEHEDMRSGRAMEHLYKKVDEVPFDFVRRRMSVVVQDASEQHVLICKGAVEEVVDLCNQIELGGKLQPLDESHMQASQKLVQSLNEDGFRVLALAMKSIEKPKNVYEPEDETEMTLLGLLAFLDPPKESVAPALKQLVELGVRLLVLTGDNDAVTRRVCSQVDFPCARIVLGSEIEHADEDEVAKIISSTNVFAKLSPNHKSKILNAIQQSGHVVGFLGDGINDAPALRAADVGISVDTAVDMAKESSDIILLEKSLMVLKDGIIEGRKVFGNILKYIKMAASSNFGNMFSIVGASVLLPFLPMLPLQILTINLLYDFSQTAIPTDNVDSDWLLRPRRWSIADIRHFILCIGPISSVFDYATFMLMLYFFNCWSNPALFHTGWFVESLLTQTLIIHVIRTEKIPFLQSTASTTLIITSLVIAGIGVWLPASPLAGTLGLVQLPALYWPCVGIMLLSYIALTQLVKGILVKQLV